MKSISNLKRRKNMKVRLIILTIFLLIMLTIMWMGFGQITTTKTKDAVALGIFPKIMITIGMIIVIIIGWVFYNNQKNLDKKNLKIKQTNK